MGCLGPRKPGVTHREVLRSKQSPGTCESLFLSSARPSCADRLALHAFGARMWLSGPLVAATAACAQTSRGWPCSAAALASRARQLAAGAVLARASAVAEVAGPTQDPAGDAGQPPVKRSEPPWTPEDVACVIGFRSNGGDGLELGALYDEWSCDWSGERRYLSPVFRS
jgi:hypothetical protein